MSSIKITVFMLLFLLVGLADCSPVMIKDASHTPTSIPVTKAPALPSATNTDEPSLVPPTATRQVLEATPTPTPNGTLVIEIVYIGQWYRETFNYQADAPYIRHMALVMPVDDEIILESPGWVFSSLTFTPSPEPFALREERIEYEPFLEYLFDAPGGIVSIDLVPGRYNVAVAFLAAALPPPDNNAILYPGVTGGGASNEFQMIEVRAGETVHLTVELTDENGWGWLDVLALK
jgi:hypothetical protein